MWLAWTLIHERFTDWCWRVPIPANTKTYWTPIKCKNYSNYMWWCSYCGTNFRRSSFLLGWRWLWLTWSSWFSMYAKRLRWIPLSAKAKNDSRSQATWSKRSLLRKSTHSYCIKNRAYLFMGCWGLRVIRSSWYLSIPSRWRWLSILTYSKTCKCPKPFEIN